MSATTTPTKERLFAIAERLRERSSDLDKIASRIAETDEPNSNALLEASQHLDDAAYILEELKLT